jgi:hypothetical protein
MLRWLAEVDEGQTLSVDGEEQKSPDGLAMADEEQRSMDIAERSQPRLCRIDDDDRNNAHGDCISGRGSTLHTIIVEETPTRTRDSVIDIDPITQEPASKRCRVSASFPETIPDRCSVEPSLATPPKHSYASNMQRNLEDEQILELILALLRKKGERIANLIKQRVASGQGAFLFKKDQFIAANLLDKALQQWRSSQRAVHSADKMAQEQQRPHTSTATESPVRMSYSGWKQCAKLVECGIARDMMSAAKTMQAAEGNPDVAAAMLLSQK